MKAIFSGVVHPKFKFFNFVFHAENAKTLAELNFLVVQHTQVDNSDRQDLAIKVLKLQQYHNNKDFFLSHKA